MELQPQRQLLISADDGGGIMLWDAEGDAAQSPQLLFSLTTLSPIRRLHLQGQCLFSCGADALRVWDVQRVGEAAKPATAVRAMAALKAFSSTPLGGGGASLRPATPPAAGFDSLRRSMAGGTPPPVPHREVPAKVRSPARPMQQKAAPTRGSFSPRTRARHGSAAAQEPPKPPKAAGGAAGGSAVVAGGGAHATVHEQPHAARVAEPEVGVLWTVAQCSTGQRVQHEEFGLGAVTSTSQGSVLVFFSNPPAIKPADGLSR